MTFDPAVDDFATVVAAARCPGSATTDEAAPTGMAEALLREIAEHMAAVAAGAGRRVVTLRGLPIGPPDYRVLRDRLGEGEVRATVAVEGETEIFETALRGVWWVRDRNAEGEVTGEHIEIGATPMLIEAHRDDIRADAAALAAGLAGKGGDRKESQA